MSLSWAGILFGMFLGNLQGSLSSPYSMISHYSSDIGPLSATTMSSSNSSNTPPLFSSIPRRITILNALFFPSHYLLCFTSSLQIVTPPPSSLPLTASHDGLVPADL